MTAKIILIILALLEGAYTVFLGIVRYRSASNPMPESVSDVYDADSYKKWQKYNAEHNKLNIVFAIISTLTMLALLVFDLHSAFASLFSNNDFTAMFAVVLLAVLVSFVLDTVKAYVSNMIIEEKYGFNRSGLGTFIFDRVLSLVLEFGLSFGIGSLILSLHNNLGAYMIAVFAAAVFIVSFLISFFYPILTRVANKFTPLPDGELKNKLMALLEKHGYRVKAIEIMDASRRTTKTDAYFTGFGKLKTIVLYDNLVNSMTEDEICAIFAHEMGHGIHKDTLRSQLGSFFYMLIIGTIAWLAASIPTLYTELGFTGVNYGFTFVVIGLCLGILQPLFSLIQNYLSRKAEYRADNQAVLEGYGEAMISSLKKLAKDNFANLSPSEIDVVLEYDHPPINKRIETAMRDMESGI